MAKKKEDGLVLFENPDNPPDTAFEKIESEEKDKDSSPAEYEILTYPADYTLEVLADRLKKKVIKIPDFQRKFVWTQAQASKLIESFLLGLPVPPIYLYSSHNDGTSLVVDGQQRLRSIGFFFEGYFGEEENGKRPTFRLIGLNEKSRFLNRTYKELEDHDNEAFLRLNDAVLRSFIIKQLNPKDNTSIYHIFERLNTGGTFLQGQEIRNCIYPGPFNDMLHKLNELPNWRAIFGKPSEDKRQRDVELILRFFALYMELDEYEKPMKEFLNVYMDKNKKSNKSSISSLARVFTTTVDRVYESLGPKPFHIRSGLNTAVYDSVFVAFAKNQDKAPDIDGKTLLLDLLADEKYNKAISSGTTDTDSIIERIKLASKAIFGTQAK